MKNIMDIMKVCGFVMYSLTTISDCSSMNDPEISREAQNVANMIMKDLTVKKVTVEEGLKDWVEKTVVPNLCNDIKEAKDAKAASCRNAASELVEELEKLWNIPQVAENEAFLKRSQEDQCNYYNVLMKHFLDGWKNRVASIIATHNAKVVVYNNSLKLQREMSVLQNCHYGK